MSKKFIMVNGKKVYVDEKDIQDDDGKEPAAADAAADEAAADAEAKAVADKITSEVKKSLGLDKIEEVSKMAAKLLETPMSAKLKEILHGKDMVREKDQLTREEKIVGFFHALVTRDEAAVKALSEGVAADGGNLFPDEFSSEIVKNLVQGPRMRNIVRVITMRRDVMVIPTLANRPKVYWTAENAAKTTTTANFSTATLTARKAAAILYASDELIEDSTEIDVVNLVISLFADAIGIEEDRVLLAGNGTTEPTGIVTATWGSTVNSGNLSFDNILELIYSLKTQYRPGASFLVHPTNIKELRKLKDTTGRYLWDNPATVGAPSTLSGYPVYEFYDVPEAKIFFGNWKLAYWMGDRKAMTVKISNDTETAFTKDQTAIRVVFRIAGNQVLAEAGKVLTTIP
jgi:HK97 family phage major capsid protein